MSAAAVSFANASEASERSESNRATADEIALVALRTRTDALFSDDADGRILVELDAVELPTAGVARDARVVALASIVDDLDALASSPSGRVASEARMLRDALADAGLTEGDPGVETLAEVATTARFAVRRSPSAPEVAALEALSATGRLTRLVVKDAIVADALRSDADLSARLDRFFAGAATYLPDRDPVLGPLDDRPVAGAPADWPTPTWISLGRRHHSPSRRSSEPSPTPSSWPRIGGWTAGRPLVPTPPRWTRPSSSPMRPRCRRSSTP